MPPPFLHYLYFMAGVFTNIPTESQLLTFSDFLYIRLVIKKTKMLQSLIISLTLLIGTSEKDVIRTYGIPQTQSRLIYSPASKWSKEQKDIIECLKKEKMDILILTYPIATFWVNDAPSVADRKVIAVY